jgi:bifunctional non-homologous end joining protein LigD
MRSRGAAGRLAFIEPMLPTMVEKPPKGGGWIHEVKFDGYRTQLVIDAGGVRAFTRRGHDWTARYRPIVAEADKLLANYAIIDGEMILPNASGHSDFHAFRKAIAGSPESLAFVRHQAGRTRRVA